MSLDAVLASNFIFCALAFNSNSKDIFLLNFVGVVLEKNLLVTT